MYNDIFTYYEEYIYIFHIRNIRLSYDFNWLSYAIPIMSKQLVCRGELPEILDISGLRI